MPLSSFQNYHSKFIFSEKCHTTTLLWHQFETHGHMYIKKNKVLYNNTVTVLLKGTLDKYNIIPQHFSKKVEIFIPLEVLA